MHGLHISHADSALLAASQRAYGVMVRHTETQEPAIMIANTNPAPTLDQALRALGYSHRPHSDKGREVFRKSDGEVIGIFDAKDAWAFLAQQTK